MDPHKTPAHPPEGAEHVQEHAHVLLDWAQTLRSQTMWQLPHEVRMRSTGAERSLSEWPMQLLVIAVGVLTFYWMAVHGMWLIFALFLSSALAYCVQQWRIGQKEAVITRLGFGNPPPGQLGWKGCTVRVADGQVYTEGLRPAWQADIRDAQDWSVGVALMATRHAVFYRLELRHVRKGPVGHLCTLYTTDTLGPFDLRAMDVWVDTVAQCLRLRRSGARLVRN